MTRYGVCACVIAWVGVSVCVRGSREWGLGLGAGAGGWGWELVLTLELGVMTRC